MICSVTRHMIQGFVGLWIGCVSPQADGIGVEATSGIFSGSWSIPLALAPPDADGNVWLPLRVPSYAATMRYRVREHVGGVVGPWVEEPKLWCFGFVPHGGCPAEIYPSEGSVYP